MEHEIHKLVDSFTMCCKLLRFFEKMSYEAASEYGPAAVAIPINSEFEVQNFEEKVGGKTHVQLLSWPPNADSKLTFDRLTHVVCLEMQGIQLTSLPPEIGLCEDLEYLDLRNNCLETLPPELAQCRKLKKLLFTGNSLPYKDQMQALIELRQLNQAVGNAPPFKWSHANAMFTLMSWNLVAQYDATQHNFPKCPARFLTWEYRSELFIHTVLNLKPHVVCIQEIEEDRLGPLSERMRTIGYGCAASFASRPVRHGLPIVGVATFFLKARIVCEKTISVSFSDLSPTEHMSKLQLLSNEAVFQVSVIRVQTHSIFLINTGLHPNRFEKKVLLAQVHTIADRVDGLNGHVIICGSMGYEPDSPPHQLMTTGEEPSGTFQQRRTYRSAYAESEDPLEWTEWTEDGLRTTDYIWISPLLGPTGYIMVPSKEQALGYHHTAPNSQWPSSHIPIGVAMDVRQGIAEGPN